MAKQLSTATTSPWGPFGVVLMSCKDNFHVIRSALQISLCRWFSQFFLLSVVHYGLCEMVNSLYKIQDSENHNLLSGAYRIYLKKRRSWDKLLISAAALI